KPPAVASYTPEDNILVGNVVLYGATDGRAFIRGLAGERFAVRNSGATAVVEGVGDHGCEYMTGGTVVVLGRTGRNFAAGMSGGLAFVYDELGEFAARCNVDMAELSAVTDAATTALLRQLVTRHARFTHSPRARHLLNHWDQLARRFVAVVPVEYRRALEAHTERDLARAHVQRQERRHG
ncbi:MAG TPA: hypothetical protein VEA99_10410, partial [Gemmatimonadaceae bacterium]|nr:hypothetical protein [Gemmatimonadaceae bacterium]